MEPGHSVGLPWRRPSWTGWRKEVGQWLPESPSPGGKGRPHSFPDEPHFHLSRTSGVGLSLHVSTHLGGPVVQEELLVALFSLSFFPFEFSTLNFILTSFPDSRCWLPPMPITNISSSLVEAIPFSAKRVTQEWSGLSGQLIAPCKHMWRHDPSLAKRSARTSTGKL